MRTCRLPAAIVPLFLLTLLTATARTAPARADDVAVDPRATLEQALDAGDREAALRAFGQVVLTEPADLGDLILRSAEAMGGLGLEADLARAVAKLPPADVERVVAAARDPASPVQRRAALTVGLSGLTGEPAAEAVQVALEALGAEDAALAAAGARAAGALGGDVAIGRLVTRLELAENRSGEAAVAVEAQRALAVLTGVTHGGGREWRRYLERRPADAKVHDATHGRSIPAMIILGLIMLATYGVIAFELAPKSLAAIAGAGAAVIAGLALGLFHARPGETAYKYVHHVIEHDLGVLGVIIGTSVLVEVASRSGLFHFFAVKIVKQTRGDPQRLFLVTCLMTMLFVTFLTIAPGSLIAISLILVVTKALDYPAKPYLMLVAIAANSGALVTFASGVCTLMLGTAGDLAYVDFFRASTPMAVISGTIAYLVLRRAYAGDLVAKGDAEARQRTIDGFDEWAVVKDRKVFYRMGVILVATILGFAFAQKLGVGLDFVAFMGGTAALILSGENADEAIKKVNWSVIVFFVGLFVVIGAVQASGLLDLLASQLMSASGGSALATLLLVSVFVLCLSGVVDNIPVAATMIPIVRALEEQGLAVAPLWWALIFTSNLGGNSTPVGSISTILAMSALEKERGVKITWGEFLRVGGSVFLVQAVVVLGYIVLFYFFNLFPGT